MRFTRMSSLDLAVAALVLGSCASLPVEEGPRAERVCIDRREISSISPLDDQHAFVKLGASHYYLFTMDKGCRGLKLARAVAIEGSAARVCGDGVGLLSFEDRTVGLMRCRVERIESVADRNAALELIDARAAPE